MPQERPNHYGHLVHGDSKSRISPRFPTIGEAIEKRHQQREKIAARTLLAMVPLGGLVCAWSSFGWAISGFGLVGFILTCFYAGNRQYERNGRHLDRQRPF